MKHWETHPTYVEGCFACRITTVAASATCTPGRRTNTLFGLHSEKMLDRDREAYRRLRADGLQPQRVAGSAALERTATEKVQVEMGYLAEPKKVKEAQRISADLGVA